MRTKIFFILISLFLMQVSHAAKIPAEEKALSMVPKGEILIKNLRDYTLKTSAGTKIKLEFEREGIFQEASGLNLNRGDEFEPGGGLISLSSAAQAIARKGLKAQGEWNLENDPNLGWVYEIMEEDADKKIFHMVNARTGKLINSVDVPLPSKQTPEGLKPQHHTVVKL